MGEELLRFVDEGYGVHLLREMVRIPSVVGEERELVEFLEGEPGESASRRGFSGWRRGGRTS